jgi:phenylacetate-CoA ligase
VGPASFECWEAPGFLHLNEVEFIGEVIDPATGHPAPDGVEGELVLTNLGRTASPVIRYRTGDIVVRRLDPCRCGRTLARLEGGIRARADDMVNIRGVNVYPSSIEAVVRSCPEVVEFRSIVSTTGAMRTLRLDVELVPALGAGSAEAIVVAARVAQGLREAFGLTVPVRTERAAALRNEGAALHRRALRDAEDRGAPETAGAAARGVWRERCSWESAQT